MVDLDPPPADLAGLLVRMTELPWPTSEEERLTFFDALGLHDIESPRPDENTVGAERRLFVSELSGALSGTATMFHGEFLGLAFFASNEQVENGALARAGYAALREHLGRTPGPRSRSGAPPANPPACGTRAR
jgi:hypothetical protein